MLPVYGYNNVYPHGGAQMPADHANSEAFPPEMKLQKPGSSFTCEPWPHHFGYPVPMPYHSCCNHSPYPGYYACRPPYPHFPSPQPHPQYHEAYSLYPEPHPFHYAPPPQYFPGWNYNMGVPRDFHCRECPHSKSRMGEDKGVKIEEHEPEAEKHSSEVPAGFNNSRRPVVWIPPEYLKQEGSPAGNKSPKNAQSASRDPTVWNGWFPLDLESVKRLLEDGGVKRTQDRGNAGGLKLQEKRAEDEQKGPAFVGPQHVSKSDGGVPNVWNGWVPLDLDNIKRLLKNEELNNGQGHQPSGQERQMSSPVIWLPCDKEEKSEVGKEEDADAASEASVQRPSNSRFLPVQQGDAQKQRTIPAIEAESDTKGPNLPGDGGNVVRIIPVKRAEECADTKTEGEAQGKRADNAEGVKNNRVDDCAKNKPASPKKASKLPPVCLRVDPLPKKKNAKGGSRSPSPPGQRSERAEAAKSQPSASGNNIDQAVEGPKKDEKLLPQNKDMDTRKDGAVENRQEPKSQEVGVKPGEARKPARKVLSAVEAAVIIQSAFRGYEVRRWEPLKKLRHLAAVRERAAEVRKSIESAAGSVPLKQKVALGEALMKLLLDLDTIQGLHPSVRDIRKSLAGELVSLQERLDGLAVEQPDNSPQDPKAVESIATSDKSSMSSALTGADGQQGGEASKQVCPEMECQTDSDGSADTALPEGPLSKPSMQQIQPEVKDGAAIENPIHECQANEPCPEVSPLTEAVGAATEERVGKPDECGSIPEPDAGLLDHAHEENGSRTTGEASQMTSQQEAKVALGAEELNGEELEGASKVGEPNGEASQMTSQQEAKVALGAEELNGEELEGASKVEELETPIAEHEKHEPANLSEGCELKEQGSYVNEAEPVIGGESSCVGPGEGGLSESSPEVAPAVEPENNAKAEFEKLGESHPGAGSRAEEPNGNPVENVARQDENMSEAEGGNQPPIVQPESNAKAGFEELGESRPGADSQAEEPNGNPVENVARQDEDTNEAEGGNQPSSVTNDEKPEATEGLGLEASPISEHGEHESTESVGGVERQLEAHSQSECRNESMQDEKVGEVESKIQTRMVGENEKMRDLVEKLIASGKQQQEVISNLNGKLKDLESKLLRQRKKKRRGRVQVPRSCKASKGSLNEAAVGLAS